jgi:serine/threonine protein kinase
MVSDRCPYCCSPVDLDNKGRPDQGPCPFCGFQPGTVADVNPPTQTAPGAGQEATREQPPREGTVPGRPTPLPETTTSPTVYGPYRIVGLLGQGGMGTVYRARHESTRQEVALKTVRVRQRELLHCFRSEMHALARLGHPGLVRILETGQSDGLPWYAMEWIQGTTLHAYLRAAWERSTGGPGRAAGSGPTLGTTVRYAAADTEDDRPGGQSAVPLRPLPLSPAALRDFLTLIARLCGVLGYLHGEGIVHRDLKPRNILVRPDETPVLLDFGLACSLGSGGRERLQVSARSEGTPGYMAPEQYLGQYVDARADLYAIGCILYKGVTGQVPFWDSDPGVMLEARVRCEPLPPGRLVQGVPPALDDLLLRLLARDPRDRLGHARAVSAALGRLGAQAGDWAGEHTPRDYLYRPGFVGRDSLLKSLERRVDEALAGRRRCIFLRGSSGAGKTRLFMELARRLKCRGRNVLAGECLPLGAGVSHGPGLRSLPLHPFRGVLRAVADACLEGGAAETERLLGPRRLVLAACEPSLAELPHKPDTAAQDPEGSDIVRFRLMDALAETLAAFARRAPIVVLLDDLQWADELTLHFLNLFHLGTWKAFGIALVGTYRSEEDHSLASACRDLLADAPALDLGPLEEANLHDIIAEMLGAGEPPERFLHPLARRAQGNPFFVAELLRAAVAGGMLYRDEDGRWCVRLPEGASEETLPLPESLHELIVRRLDRLSASSRRCLELAAVLGREVEADLLEAAGLSGAELTMALQELLAAQVLEKDRNGPFQFLHDKLREVVYDQVPAERRRELHRIAAVAIETCRGAEADFERHYPALAHHWERSIGDRQAEPERVARAIDYLDRAAAQATRNALQSEAIEHGLGAARLLGADVPRTPEAVATAAAAELEEVRRLLAGREPLELLDLPPLDDPGLDRLIGLLQTIHPSAHTSNQHHLSAFLAVRNLGLTLRHGRGRTAPSVFALFTIVARNVLDDSRLADAFSRLALAEDARQGRPLTSSVAFLRGWFVDHWVGPLRNNMDSFRLGFEAGEAAGEVLYSCFCRTTYRGFAATKGGIDKGVPLAEDGLR